MTYMMLQLKFNAGIVGEVTDLKWNKFKNMNLEI